MLQLSRVAAVPGGPKQMLEVEHEVIKFRKWLPKGAGRADDLIQFIAKHGGTRTVRTKDLTVIR